MWRQNPFPGNCDSDQSISDEEELTGDLRENCLSLNINTEKEKGLLLQSRLELLRGSDDDKSSFFAEDEVEIPDFSQGKESTHHHNDEVSLDAEDVYALSTHTINPSAKKLLKDNDVGCFRNQKLDGARTWSMISKEAEALIHLNEDVIPAASAFSNAENTCKGIRGKLKPKFSLHFKSHKNGLVQPYTYMDENVMLPSPCDMPEQLEPNEDGTLEDMNFEFLEGVDEENNEKLAILPAEVEAFGNGLIKHSMAELLFGLQDGNVVLKENSKMPRRTRGKKAQLIVKKSISSLGERIIDNEEQPEPVYSGSSGDDEADHHGLSLANLVMKKQTMADQFQEALAATSFSNEEVHVTTAKLSGIGLFGKLQQVMQSEKEKDADFLSRIQMGRRPDDESCSIVVKILSRYLDANLIVCHCSFGENVEGFHLPDNAQTLSDRGKEGTVIFSPKVCSNVDLEVGNFICIHPTWKEIQVPGNDETIILSTYFSHI